MKSVISKSRLRNLKTSEEKITESTQKGSPYGIVAVVISEFEFHYYVHFRSSALRKAMNPLILPAMVYIAPLLFIYKDSFGIK